MIKHDILFRERQRFTQWWIWLLLLPVNALFAFGLYKQLILEHPFGDKPMSNEGLAITFGCTVLLSLLFLYTRLDTEIRTDGIYVRFFPFHFKFKRYSWDQLSKIFVRKYHPLTEYGGWGLRLSIFGKGWAYNISGDQGLQLVFTDKRKLLIGTQQSDELTTVLEQLGQVKS